MLYLFIKDKDIFKTTLQQHNIYIIIIFYYFYYFYFFIYFILFYLSFKNS